MEIIKSAVSDVKTQKVIRSISMKEDTSILVQLSTGDEFNLIVDGHTRTIDALLRLSFSNIPPACSVQWSLSVNSIKAEALKYVFAVSVKGV